LFVERAQAVRPDFQLTTDNSDVVARICVRLDGLPLALELAAARSKTLAPSDLLRLLDRHFDPLTGGPDDAVPRQRTLQPTIVWSSDVPTPARTILPRGDTFLQPSMIVTSCRTRIWAASVRDYPGDCLLVR
jgi:hypothetical protein